MEAHDRSTFLAVVFSHSHTRYGIALPLFAGSLCLQVGAFYLWRWVLNDFQAYKIIAVLGCQLLASAILTLFVFAFVV